MSYENLSQSAEESAGRLQRLKRLVDHLILLAPEEGEANVEYRVQQILEQMKTESLSPIEQLRQLEEIVELSAYHPEEPKLHEAINDTADFLLEELEGFSPKQMKNLENLSSVWTTIKAWDAVRSPATAELCVKVLNNYPGEGQAHLAQAFIVARRDEMPYENALDLVNSGEAA